MRQRVRKNHANHICNSRICSDRNCVYYIYIHLPFFTMKDSRQSYTSNNNNIIINLTWCLCSELNDNGINTHHFRKLVHGHFFKTCSDDRDLVQQWYVWKDFCSWKTFSKTELHLLAFSGRTVYENSRWRCCYGDNCGSSSISWGAL